MFKFIIKLFLDLAQLLRRQAAKINYTSVLASSTNDKSLVAYQSVLSVMPWLMDDSALVVNSLKIQPCGANLASGRALWKPRCCDIAGSVYYIAKFPNPSEVNQFTDE
jgi:hypothetical protein